MPRILPTAAAGSAGALALLLAAPLAAQHAEHAEHTAPNKLVTLAEWNARLTRLLDRNIRYPSPIGNSMPGQGIVRIKFNCSENGRPDQVALLKGSGNRFLDWEAVRAVKHLASLHPLPTGMKPDQKYEAVVVFASSRSDPRLASAADEQKRRNAWYRDPAMAARSGASLTKIAAR